LSQEAQAVLPPVAEVPAGHWAHDKVVPGEYWPPAQVVQLVALALAAKEPEAHAAQSEEAPTEAEAFPAAQGVQAEAPELIWNDPAAQLVQATAPVDTVNMPAGQAGQLTPPVFGW